MSTAVRQSATSSPAGRPQMEGVTQKLHAATLDVLADNGLEKTTVAAIAARARTSKQAIYRRDPTKADLVASAIREALNSALPATPPRGSVAEDLRQCLQQTVDALQDTTLGRAIRALASGYLDPTLAHLIAEMEANRRLILRQILIATPFEADMETRIDLLLGLVQANILVHGKPVTPEDIERAIFLVLGLLPPKEPDRTAGMPGI